MWGFMIVCVVYGCWSFVWKMEHEGGEVGRFTDPEVNFFLTYILDCIIQNIFIKIWFLDCKI